MFVYFDNQGTLKEIVNDSAIRQGNYGVDKIYFFIEGAVDDNGKPLVIDGVYKALDFDGGRRTFTNVEGTTLDTESFSLTTTTLEIPFDKKRELKWFKYWTNYEFFVIDLPSEVLVNHGTIKCSIDMINNDTMTVELTEEDILTAHSALTLGWLIFNVEQTATDAIIKPDTAINIAQWNYLIHNMATLDDLDGKQDKLIAGENITIEDNVISATGGGGGLTVPTFDAQYSDPEHPEFEDFQLNQEDLNDIWVNKYPLINIRATAQYVICFKLSHNVTEEAMVYAMTSMEFSNEEGHQYDLDCMSFIIALDEGTNLPIIAAVNEEYYTNDYRKLENKPNIPQIDTTIGPDSLDDTVPSSKCVYDNIQNVREVAEGKCKTYILNDYAPVIDSDSEARKYRKADGTYFTDLADFNNYIGSNNPTCINNLFNSQNADISIFEMELYDYYLVESDAKMIYSSYSGGVGGNDFWKFNKGDEFLIIQTNVPDRWFSVQSGSEGGGILLPDSFVFHVLETKTQDLSNYAQKSDVPALQATATVVNDALTNINGRVLSSYEATESSDQNYVWYTITYGGQTVTEEQAINYMEYMTGSRFLPVYNYEKPQNCVFIFADRSVWKPQYDAVNGLRLYRISTSLLTEDDLSSYVTLDTAQRITAPKSFFNNRDNNTLPLRIQGFDNHTWGLEMDKDFGRLHVKYADTSGTNISNVSDQLVLDFNSLYPATNGGKDLGTSSYYWKDLYQSGYTYFKDGSGTVARIWRMGESQYGTIELKTSNDGGVNWANRYSFQTGSFCPTVANTIDLGNNNANQKWKDFYLSGGINFSKSGETTTYSLAEQTGGSLLLSRSGTGIISFASTFFSSYNHRPIADNTYDLGNSSYAWRDLYLSGSIKDNQGNAVTVEQLYFLGKSIQGLAQPTAVTLNNGDTLTDQPTIYMMTQHLPVMINNGMCYFLTEDTNYYVYTTHTFDSSTLDVVPYKVIVNKSTFVVTIAAI